MKSTSIQWLTLVLIILINTPLIDGQGSSGYEAGEEGIRRGGNHQSPRDLRVHIIASPSTAYRGDTIILKYSVEALDQTVDDIKRMEFNVPTYLENVKVIHPSEDYELRANKIHFIGDKLNRNTCSNCTYEARIALSANPKTCDLNHTINGGAYWNYKRNLIRDNTTISTIDIFNTPPNISSAKITPKFESSSFVSSLNSIGLVYLGGLDRRDSIELDLEINASDREGETLSYIWWINNSTSNPICTSYNSRNVYHYTNLRSGNYSFYAMVNDSRNNSNESLAMICYDGKNYTHIIIPQNNRIVPLMSYATVILILLLMGIIKSIIEFISNPEYIKKIIKKYIPIIRRPTTNKIIKIIFILSIITAITYFYLTIYIEDGAPIESLFMSSYIHTLVTSCYNLIGLQAPHNSQEIDVVLYSQSLTLFETYIYLVNFIIIVFITEMIFGHHNILQSERHFSSGIPKIIYANTTTSTLWFVNSLLMLIMVLSLDSIVYKIEPNAVEPWLRSYYSIMAEIFATILAIVAAFYTTIPKNVITTKERLMFSLNEIKDSSGLIHKLNEENLLSHMTVFFIKFKNYIGLYKETWPILRIIEGICDKFLQNSLVNDLNKLIRSDNNCNKKSNQDFLYTNREKLERKYPCELKQLHDRELVIYDHPKILHNFIILYSIIVLLSIWGVSAGISAKFDPIVKFETGNIYNLISIAVLETTLLLAAPAITWLYELLRSTLFTGTIKLESKPSNAKIIVDGYDVCLKTPNKLMLPDGQHTILLKKEGYDDYKVGSINVITGTEQKYSCHLGSYECIKKNY